VCADQLIDTDVLSIEDVSRILRCSSDTVRRISLEELPVYRVGKCNLYLREEVIRYLRSKRVEPTSVDDLVFHLDAQTRGVVESLPVDVRRRPSRRTQ